MVPGGGGCGRRASAEQRDTAPELSARGDGSRLQEEMTDMAVQLAGLQTKAAGVERRALANMRQSDARIEDLGAEAAAAEGRALEQLPQKDAQIRNLEANATVSGQTARISGPGCRSRARGRGRVGLSCACGGGCRLCSKMVLAFGASGAICPLSSFQGMTGSRHSWSAVDAVG